MSSKGADPPTTVVPFPVRKRRSNAKRSRKSAATKAQVYQLSEQPPRRTHVDVSKWQAFAIAYIDENGATGYALWAPSPSNAKALLTDALLRLNVATDGAVTAGL